MDVFVANKELTLPSGDKVRCAIGRGGINLTKMEGDGVTPIGNWEMRRILYRPDKLSAPISGLPAFPVTKNDGWCDESSDPNYNKPVKRPYPTSCEAMWRDDNLYDVVVILGHNDNPPIAGLGSAIFLHVAKADYSPTEGCVALPIKILLKLLKSCNIGDRLCIGN